MDTRFTNTRESLAKAQVANIDWTSLTTGDRIRFLELEGYVVIPDLLSASWLEEMRVELSKKVF